MNRSQADSDLIPELGALQHEPALRQHAPRPLPLFLSLVAEAAAADPELGRAALAGLRTYAEIERQPARGALASVARCGGASLRDHGGEGPPAVLIPSLINPPTILDLDERVSLSAAVIGMDRRVFSVDWGPAADRTDLSISGHVEQLLLPLIASIGAPAALIGYCLGGTMAIAAANLIPVERVATLAAPWRFSAYPDPSRAALLDMWARSRPAAQALNALPMEVLQAAFWSLDPERTVRKFADFAKLYSASPEARRFVELEDWANEGEALPFRAAEELIADLFGEDRPGSGKWRIGGQPITDRIAVPVLHVTAKGDRIAPAATAPSGPSVAIESGHVGMIVGSKRAALHVALAEFLKAGCR